MILSKKSIISGKVHKMELDITEEQYFSWKNGELVQNVFPHLNSEEREFIVSGITPQEWKELFGEEA
jgi:uncharacterized protein (DUF779 family)